MSFFSFLFSSSDSSTQRGAKSDGKGIAELKSENNTDAGKNLQQAKKISLEETPATAIQINKRQRYRRHKNRLNPPFKRHEPRETEKRHFKKFSNTQEITRRTERTVRCKTKKIEQNPQTSEQAIRRFIETLDPSVQEVVKQNMIKKVNQQHSSTNYETSAKDNLQEAPMNIQMRVNEKRGINTKSKRLQMLEVAKHVAEKARQMVKDFRVKILNKNQHQPIQTNPLPKQEKKFKNQKRFQKDQGRS